MNNSTNYENFQKQKEERIKQITERITSCEQMIEKNLQYINEMKRAIRYYEEDLEELQSAQFANYQSK
jgi:chromosome segregation ATPase